MATKTRVVALKANTTQVRVRLHPGVAQYYRNQNNPRLLHDVLTDYFLKHADADDIDRYITPHEKVYDYELKSGEEK